MLYRTDRANTLTRIMVFGTFDILHAGHLHFFKQARKLTKNPYLIVSIARDVNVKRIKRKLPLNNERKRAARVRESDLVDEVVLGGTKGYITHIARAAPQIIALGYDQHAYTENLSKDLLKIGLLVRIVRLKSYKPNMLKSSLIGRHRS